MIITTRANTLDDESLHGLDCGKRLNDSIGGHDCGRETSEIERCIVYGRTKKEQEEKGKQQ